VSILKIAKLEFIQHPVKYFSEAGNGDLEVSVVNDVTKQVVPVQIIDNEDNTYSVEVNPDAPGTYTTNLTYGGLKVPFSKKTVIGTVADTSKVQVEGLEQSEYSRVRVLRVLCAIISDDFFIR
jgi:hypothetical protein